MLFRSYTLQEHDNPKGRSSLANRHLAGDSTPSHRAPLDTDTCPSLDTTDISPGHTPSPKYQTPTVTPLDTDSIRWPNILNGIFPDVKWDLP